MAWNLYTWGSKGLYVKKGSYNPPASDGTIVEIPLIPSSTDVTAIASVLQQSGGKRKKASFVGYATETDYLSLEADFEAATSRTFTDLESNTFTAIIIGLTPTYLAGWPLPYLYSATLLEV